MARKRRGRRHPDSDSPYYEVVDEVDGPDQYEDYDEDYEESPRRRRGRRRREPRRKRSWLSRIFILLLLLLAAVAALPTIVTQTPLRHTALNWAGKTIGLEVQAEQVSGGWFAQPAAENVTIRDQQGQPLLEVASLRLDRNLISLLRNQRDLGVIHLQKPVAHLALREDGNNWMDALKPLLENKSDERKPPQLQLIVEEGVVHVQDPRKLQTLNIGPLQLEATVDQSQQTPIRCKVATRLSDSVGQSGELTVALDSNSMDFASGEAKISSSRMPLATVQTLLRSVAPDLQMTGDLDLQSILKWNIGEAPRAHLQIDSMEVANFRMRSAALPPGDKVALALLQGAGGIRWEDGNLLADNLQLKSDVASVAATGRVKLSRLLAQGFALGNEDEMDVAAQFDVARLAEMMPTTLRIRDDTQIDSGLVQASLNSKLEQGQRVWHGVLTTSKVAATTRGQQVQWEQPIAVEFDATQQGGNWAVRKLNCISSFLQVQGSGQPNAGRLDINGDLNRLRTELSQFINLGDIRLAGKAGGFIAWQPGAAGPQANGRIDLSQFQLELPGKTPLVEPQLALQFTAAGKRGAQGEITSIESGELTVNAGDDQMLVQLTSPVAYNSPQAQFPLQVKVSGDLSRWLMRAAVLTDQPDLKGEGAFSFDGAVILSQSQLAISRSELNAKHCRIEGIGIPIDEPELTADIIGAYDFPTQRWIGGKSTIKTATFAAGCNNLSIQPGVISGDIGLRGDLPRILRVLGMERGDQHYEGQFSGTVRLSQQQGETHFAIKQRMEQFAVLHLAVQPLRTVSTTPTWKTSWSEPFIDLDTTGVYTPATGTLNFQSLKVGLDSAQADVTGNLADLSGRIHANLNGQLSYNLERLTKKLKPVIGNSVVLEGVSRKPISIRGPLRPAPVDPALVSANASAQPLLPMDLIATASFQWDAAAIEGFRVGPGQINTTLEQATVRFDGMQIPVSQGKVLLAPQVSFRTSSPVLTVPPGPVVENLMISQEMTHTWMKYLAPMLADATTVQGTFSADVEQVSIPLTNASAGEIKGRLKIHGAQAGPGPLAQQLIAFVQQTENVVKNVGNGAGNINLDRALELLNNGALVNPQGQLDPQRALGGLLGGLGGNATAPASNNNAIWLQVPEHQVGFHVAQGRVYHQGMRVVVDNIEVQTTGSVGLDESLDLIAQLPIPAKWLGDSPALASLQGQTLRVPITGTIRNPKLDRRVVQSMMGQLLNGAATGAVGNIFGQGPAGQGGVPRMLPTDPNAPSASPNSTGAPNASDPASNLNNNIQNGINNAAGNAQREVDRALRKLFGN